MMAVKRQMATNILVNTILETFQNGIITESWIFWIPENSAETAVKRKMAHAVTTWGGSRPMSITAGSAMVTDWANTPKNILFQLLTSRTWNINKARKTPIAERPTTMFGFTRK